MMDAGCHWRAFDRGSWSSCGEGEGGPLSGLCTKILACIRGWCTCRWARIHGSVGKSSPPCGYFWVVTMYFAMLCWVRTLPNSNFSMAQASREPFYCQSIRHVCPFGTISLIFTV